MMLYKNMKVNVYSPDGDTDYFDIITGLLQGDALAPYLFINYLDYVLRTSIDIMKYNGFKLAKERNRKCPAQTITDVDYVNDIMFLANKSAQAKTLLDGLERASIGIGLHVNADKKEYMYFNQRGNISTVNVCSLKLVDKFNFQGSSVSSTKKDVNIWLAKAWIDYWSYGSQTWPIK